MPLDGRMPGLTAFTLLRPLLAFRKPRLIATCERHGVPYVTDRSNSNTAFDRVRARQVVVALPDDAAEAGSHGIPTVASASAAGEPVLGDTPRGEPSFEAAASTTSLSAGSDIAVLGPSGAVVSSVSTQHESSAALAPEISIFDSRAPAADAGRALTFTDLCSLHAHIGRTRRELDARAGEVLRAAGVPQAVCAVATQGGRATYVLGADVRLSVDVAAWQAATAGAPAVVVEHGERTHAPQWRDGG
jgi:hypothetical protein